MRHEVFSEKTIAVIGAGPKAMAIASKASVLKKLGFHVPKIVIVEKNEIGSNWSGKFGFTNGRQPLGTSPEKDIGFPYYSHCWGEEFNSRVNAEMLAFSWQRFLVGQFKYSDWIDRGRPHPEHRKWAAYLEWAYAQLQDGVRLVKGEVTRLDLVDNRWRLTTPTESITADGFVVTGPGKLKMLADIPKDERVKTLETFWRDIEAVKSLPPNAHVAVVGSGETAASVVLYLGNARSDLTIDLVVPTAMSYSRGESYVENHVYTDPFQSNWMSWTREDRVNFIQRTDRGVFSVFAKHCLDQWEFVEIIPGWFRSLRLNSGNQLVLDLEYNGDKEHRIYDFVVLSMGFDPWTQVLSLIDPPTLEELKKKLDVENPSSDWVESRIGQDLSLTGLSPKIHLPMMAGLEQGPGFGNLSCLGRLSDHILQSYVYLK